MPIVTLLTDFGTEDTYVAQMKGVVLSIIPQVTLVDISHSIPAQDVLAGAAALREAMSCFPSRTVHVAVVDPGVGTSRRIIAAKIADQFFVLPDNGLLTRVLSDYPLEAAVELTQSRYWQPSVSSTFHGRDIMAPVAAHLASGTPLLDLGPVVDALVQLDEPKPKQTADAIIALVVAVDHFGNAITNVPSSMIQPYLKSDLGELVQVEIQQQNTLWRWSRTYGESPAGTHLALVGSQGYLELAVNRGSAAATYGIAKGDSLKIRCAKFFPNG